MINWIDLTIKLKGKNGTIATKMHPHLLFTQYNTDAKSAYKQCNSNLIQKNANNEHIATSHNKQKQCWKYTHQTLQLNLIK